MLTSNHKDQRKRALKEHLARLEDAGQLDENIKETFEAQHLQLVNVLNDPVEACRDLAVDILQRYFSLINQEERDLNYVIPTLFRRLGCQERVETSEEVRLKCVCLLKIIISRYQAYLPIYVDCLVQIFAQTLIDNYPLIKNESCDCVCLLARNLTGSARTQLENLVKPTLSATNHRHYKIRVTGIRTIGELMMYLSANSVEDVTTALAERLFDQNGLVRGAVVEVAGNWMIKFPHRYSWFHKILPLLLTGLHDTVKEVRLKSSELWEEAGKQYLEENKEDQKLKDKMDYLIDPPLHYPNIIRPNLGCRVLAQLNFSKLINGIALELTDWMADIRVRSAQLLCVFVLHVEDTITQHIEKILPAMYRACNDENEGVVTNVEKAAEYMGHFVPPSLYCQLILPTIEDAPTAGHLRVLSAILRGSDSVLLIPKLKEIGGFLRQPQICQSRKAKYQGRMLSCCESLLRVCQSDCKGISEELYTIIFSVLSMAANKIIQQEAEELFKTLVSVTDCEPQDLHDQHAGQLLSSFVNCESWSVHTPESLIFGSYLINAVSVIPSNGDTVLSILKTTLSTESDPELRLRYFILLSQYFAGNLELNCPELFKFIRSFVETCILSNLVWTAGRSAEAIRISVVCCLCALLQCYESLSKTILQNESCKVKKNIPDEFSKSLRKMVPVLISLVDDNATKTRLYSLEAIGLLMSIEAEGNDQLETIHRVYPVVLKRLDDGSDEVRAQALQTLTKVWSFLPEDYDLCFNKGHVDSMYMTMIVHLDDSCPEFRESAYESLKQLAKIHPELLHQKLQKSLPKFRNPDKIEELVRHCQSILHCTDS